MRPNSSYDGRRERLDLIPVDDVGRHCEHAGAEAADLGRDLLDGRQRPCRDDDVGAVGRAAAGQRGTEPGPGTDDHDHSFVDEHALNIETRPRLQARRLPGEADVLERLADLRLGVFREHGLRRA